MKTILRGTILAVWALSACGICQSTAGQSKPKTAACAAEEYRQFDFWAGDWDVVDLSTHRIVARARVDKILGGCVLREDYEQDDGMHGQSFNIYDAARKVWHETWVTNDARLLVIEGKFENGAMVLSGVDHAKNGIVRGTWKPANGGVRETAILSDDGGKTWKPWFDLMFQPHRK